MLPGSVLLVDHDPDSLAMYSLVLEYNGFFVYRASSGAEAFEKACAELPDVVITELHLPDASTFCLVEQLREDVRTSAIPIVAVTSVPVRSGAPARALTFCDACLPKPCVPSRLLAEVKDRLGRVQDLVSDL